MPGQSSKVNLDPDLFASPDGEWRIIYKKLLIHAAFPIICGCCAYAGWYVILKYRILYAGELPSRHGTQQSIAKDFQTSIYTRFSSTLIILLFLVHPMISQFMVNMFRCSEYDHDMRLKKELEVLCWRQAALRPGCGS